MEEMKLFSFKANSIIFDTDKVSKYFFIIKKGRVEIVVDGKVNEILEAGKGFGEVALLLDGKRTSRARAIEACDLWCLSKDSYKLSVKAQNIKVHSENKEFLRTLPLFNLLNENDLEALSEVLAFQSFSQCDVIVNEGEPGDLAYIIKSGTVGCYINKEEKRQLGPGDFFGEQALLYDTRRTATVIAISQVEVLSLGRRDLSKVLGGHLEAVVYRNSVRMAFDRSPAFSLLLNHQIEALIEKLDVYKYNPGDVVVEKGTLKKVDVFIVLNGALEGEGNYDVFQCIGDEELLKPTENAYKKNIVAAEGSVVGKITKESIFAVIGDDFEKVVKTNKYIEVLYKVPLFKHLSFSRIESMLPFFKSKTYKKDEVLFNQGEDGTTFYIITKGSARILVDNKEIRTVGKNDFFGERSILKNEARTATVIAREELKCGIISSHAFKTIMDEPVRLNLVKRMELQNDSIMLTDLQPVALAGKGQFGSVFLCKDRNNVEYALKSIPRGMISHYDLVENLMLERKILLLLDHPMIVKLVKTFKTNNRVCFLMEYVKGMDLFDVLRALNILKEPDCLFYSCCLILILQHIHSQSIIYRDLKPENVMVDSDGYPKLVDFGISRIIKGRTYTIIGTPHYMAPEVITGKGYGIQADYWSLGIMIYEFIYCNVPFAPRDEDPYAVYEKILERNLSFPEQVSIPTANKLIQQLLSTNPSLRGTIETIKDHKWFKGMAWEKLLDKILTPPYKPEVKPPKKCDSGNRGIIHFLDRYDMQNEFRGEYVSDKKWEFEF
jgi:cGMP-dependent protein kinase